MKKVVVFFILISIILTSCSNTKINTNSPAQKVSPVLSDTPQNTPPLSVTTAIPAEKNLIELEGTIKDLKIHMYIGLGYNSIEEISQHSSDGSFVLKPKEIEGYYYYDSEKINIKLKGRISWNRWISFDEYDTDGSNTGKFEGTYVPGVRFFGNWTNAKTNESLPFELKIKNGIIRDAVWSGEWNRMHSGIFDTSNIVIFNESDNRFEFQIFAFSGGHSGTICGVAYIEGSKAKYKVEKTGVELIFSLKGGIISLVANKAANNRAGMGVFFDGNYTKGKLDDFTLTSSGYLKSPEQEKKFIDMVGKDADLFLHTVQLYSISNDLDGFGATVYKWMVRGLAGSNESIIMFLPDGSFCAAVIDPYNSKVKVYTNASFINEIPKTIKEWSNSFSKLPMEFIKKSSS